MTPQKVPTAMFKGLFWDIGLVLIAYYGLRIAGADEYVALLAATVIAGLRVVIVAMRERTLDLFAGFLLAVFGIGLILAVITHDPSLALMAKSGTTGVAGVLFTASMVVRRPLSYAALQRFSTPDERTAYDQLWAESAAFRTRNYRLTALWGFGLLTDALLRVLVVVLFPLDVAAGVSSAVEIAVIAVLVLITRRVIIRAKAAQSADAVTAAAVA
ncbi:VC0807 family protein [Antrihabitans cavernicola]|uniref:DUF3159 domain-containing protein n=1 Tax=Antrihabitans cavernicola TaxID=2495913 RepID=A0A5A7SH37_9NOCA|nr:VC0807 family protein [Spelaeibacter cavernicola]KAA0024462.1 hypothetical protein FOY51_00375 [Spelaeibacter cavernicola]